MKDWNDREVFMFGLFRQQSRVVPSQWQTTSRITYKVIVNCQIDVEERCFGTTTASSFSNNQIRFGVHVPIPLTGDTTVERLQAKFPAQLYVWKRCWKDGAALYITSLVIRSSYQPAFGSYIRLD